MKKFLIISLIIFLITGCGKSNEKITGKYGYKTKGDTKISATKPTDKHAYFRYELKDGSAEGIIPEACIYSEDYPQKELCLKNNELENSKQKILDYFGYDANTWKKIDDYKWTNSTNTITCNIRNSGYTDCSDSIIIALVNEFGSVGAQNKSSNIRCNVAYDGTGDCQ